MNKHNSTAPPSVANTTAPPSVANTTASPTVANNTASTALANTTAPLTSPNNAIPTNNRTMVQNMGLILAFIVLGGILLLPTPETLSTGGHRMIGVLSFAIILWMTSAVSYPVSATMITALTALLLGFSPNPEAPAKAMGTSNAYKNHFRLFFPCDDSCRRSYVYLCSYA